MRRARRLSAARPCRRAGPATEHPRRCGRNGPDRRRACRRLHAPGHRHRNHGYRAGNGRLHRRSHVSQRAPRNRLPPRIAGQVPVPAHRQHGGHGVALVPGRILPRPSRRSSGICSAGRAGAKRPLRVRRAGVPAVFIRQRGSRRLSRSPRRILRRAAFHHAGPFRPQRDGIRRVSAAGLFRHAERSGLSRRHRVLAGRRRAQRCVAADQSRRLRPHVPRARVQRGHRHGCRPFGRVGQRTHRPRRFPLPR